MNASLKCEDVRHECLHAWNFPPLGWVCLNTNGSMLRYNHVACGGLIIDVAGSARMLSQSECGD